MYNRGYYENYTVPVRTSFLSYIVMLFLTGMFLIITSVIHINITIFKFT